MCTFSIHRCPAFGLWANAKTIPMMRLSSSEIKNTAMNELPLFSVIAPATKHKLIQMTMTRNTTASMAAFNHKAPSAVKRAGIVVSISASLCSCVSINLASIIINGNHRIM